MHDGHDVIVIGAGPAGCAAGYQLSRAGRSCCMLERLSIVGGLARTIERNGARYDIGPHRFFTKSPRVLDLWQETGKNLLVDVRRLTRILYGKRLLHYPLQPINAMLGLGVGKSVYAVLSYVLSQARQLAVPRAPRTFEEWVINQFGYALYQAFFKTYTEKVWGIPCSEIASDWASQRIKGLSLAKAVVNAFTGGRTSQVRTMVDHFVYPRYGSGSIYETMCRRIVERGGCLECGCEVVKIQHDGRRVVSVTVRRGDMSEANMCVEHLISTMPITDLIQRMDPPPPDSVKAAASALMYRTHICVNLLLDKSPFPDNWIYIHRPDVRVGRMANYVNFSSEMCDQGGLFPVTFEYFAFPGDETEQQSDAGLTDLAIREGRSTGILQCDSTVDAFVVRNPQAYCVIKSGYDNHRSMIQHYLSSFENMQTAGRAGMFKYNNQDHSVMTGLLAAENVAGTAHDLWSVNIDGDYHESGTAPDLCVEDREEMSGAASE